VFSTSAVTWPRTPGELREALDFYRRFREASGVRSSVIVLDEVTGVEAWWRVVKGYVDLGFFENDVVILLGSASFIPLEPRYLWLPRAAVLLTVFSHGHASLAGFRA